MQSELAMLAAHKQQLVSTQTATQSHALGWRRGHAPWCGQRGENGVTRGCAVVHPRRRWAQASGTMRADLNRIVYHPLVRTHSALSFRHACNSSIIFLIFFFILFFFLFLYAADVSSSFSFFFVLCFFLSLVFAFLLAVSLCIPVIVALSSPFDFSGSYNFIQWKTLAHTVSKLNWNDFIWKFHGFVDGRCWLAPAVAVDACDWEGASTMRTEPRLQWHFSMLRQQFQPNVLHIWDGERLRDRLMSSFSLQKIKTNKNDRFTLRVPQPILSKNKIKINANGFQHFCVDCCCDGSRCTFWLSHISSSLLGCVGRMPLQEGRTMSCHACVLEWICATMCNRTHNLIASTLAHFHRALQ